MIFGDYLASEWKPALGCTEPASIAYAASNAAKLVSGKVRSIHLVCDPRIYKNCYAVAIPHSDHKIGIRWALAIGALLPDPSLRLECFKQVDESVLSTAASFVNGKTIRVEVDSKRQGLYVDCRIEKSGGVGRVVIEGEHTRITRVEKDGVLLPNPASAVSGDRSAEIRKELSNMPFDQLVELARSISAEDRKRLCEGAEWNLAIARHGLSLFPPRFVELSRKDSLSRISVLVCAGVYARMWGEEFVVMSLAGSGNKGIVCSTPIYIRGPELQVDRGRMEEALALACLVTSSTTHYLGSLSAVCGCSNAAGIGLAAGLVYLEGYGPKEMSLSINNMVGNVTGMICDGAKIGCALKTMTAVDAAFRSAALANSGIGIPVSDGIVGSDGLKSLHNLGRIVLNGMTSTDAEILKIMQEKLGQ
jgi:L-cysteine desulfidase